MMSCTALIALVCNAVTDKAHAAVVML